MCSIALFIVTFNFILIEMKPLRQIRHHETQAIEYLLILQI